MKLNLCIIRQELADITEGGNIISNDFKIWCAQKIEDHCFNDFGDGICYIVKVSDARKIAIPHNANLILINDDKNDFYTNCNYIIVKNSVTSDELFLRTTNIFLNYYKWKDSIFKAINADLGLKEILKIGYEKIGNPIAICDTSLNCIAQYGQQYVKGQCKVWPSEKGKDKEKDSISLNALLKQQGVLDKIRAEKGGFIYTLPGDDYSVLHQNVFFQNKRIAYLFAVSANKQFDNYALSIIKKFSDLISSMLVIKIGIKHESLSNIDLITRKYLNGQPVEEKYRDNILAEYGWNINDKYTVCQFETLRKEKEYDVMPDIVHFQGIISECAIFYYGIGIFVLQNLTRANMTFKEFTDFANEISKKFDYACGISNEFNDYTIVRLEKIKSTLALNAARKKSLESNNIAIEKYDDCMLESALGIFEEYNDLRLLCRSDVYKLYLYDLEHNTEYIDSLYTYLSTGNNYVESSKRLFIHRNTFIYRLKKIVEIMGNDAFSGNDSSLELLLSCKAIIHIRDAKKKENEDGKSKKNVL